MAPHDILSTVRRNPFAPFRLVLADGAKFDILHPDQCMVMEREVLIGEPDAAGNFIDWTLKIKAGNVLAIESMGVAAPELVGIPV